MASERESLQSFGEEGLSSHDSLTGNSDVEVEPTVADVDFDTQGLISSPVDLGPSEWQMVEHRSMSQCGSSPRSLSRVDLLESPDRFGSDDSSVSEQDEGGEPARRVPELLMREAEELMMGTPPSRNNYEADALPRSIAAASASLSETEDSPDITQSPSTTEDEEEVEMDSPDTEAVADSGLEGLLGFTESASGASGTSAPVLSNQSSYASISVPSEVAAAAFGGSPPEIMPSPFGALPDEGIASSTSVGSLASDEQDILPDTGVCSVVTGYPVDSVFTRAASRPGSLGSGSSEYARLSDESPLPRGRSPRAPPRPTAETSWSRWIGAAGGTQAGRMLKQMWGTLQAYARRMGAVIPPKLRARIQRLLACLEAPHSLSEKGQPRLLVSAFVAVSVLLAITCVKNRSLARSLQARDSELQHHILMVLDLNNKLTNAVDIPIMRHTAFRSSLSFGSTVF